MRHRIQMTRAGSQWRGRLIHTPMCHIMGGVVAFWHHVFTNSPRKVDHFAYIFTHLNARLGTLDTPSPKIRETSWGLNCAFAIPIVMNIDI